MMVTWVRGLFKDIHGSVQLDWDRPLDTTFQGEIDVTKLWTGVHERDAHLRSADFFDVEHHPRAFFTGHVTERIGHMHARASVDLTIRGVTRPVTLEVAYLGQWETPFWAGDENRGTLRRIGFEGTTTINRHDFGVSWQDSLPRGGVVVSNEIYVALDVEAILEDDLERTGAIEYYREEAQPTT